MPDDTNPYVEEELRKARLLYEQRMSSPTVRRAQRAYTLCLGLVILATLTALCLLATGALN